MFVQLKMCMKVKNAAYLGKLKALTCKRKYRMVLSIRINNAGQIPNSSKGKMRTTNTKEPASVNNLGYTCHHSNKDKVNQFNQQIVIVFTEDIPLCFTN
jgi:hypothetical protein